MIASVRQTGDVKLRSYVAKPMHTRTLTIVSRNQDFTVQVCLHREDEKQDDKYMCLCSGFENVLLRMAERPRFDVQSKAECVQHEQHQPNVISGVWTNTLINGAAALTR